MPGSIRPPKDGRITSAWRQPELLLRSETRWPEKDGGNQATVFAPFWAAADMRSMPPFRKVGDRDMENGTVSVRTRKGEDLGAMTMDAFLSKCLAEIASKSKDI